MYDRKKIKVLVVDDSIVSRKIISKGIGDDRSMEVVGTASDPFEARDKIISLLPDVLTLDINMPKMNGISFLKKLMVQYPIPVVIVSSSANSVFEALEAGAVDFVVKPNIQTTGDLETFLKEVIFKIKIASIAKMHNYSREITHNYIKKSKSSIENTKIIAIGASTGGTDAILTVIKKLPPNCPGIVVVQHMPPVFTRMYSERLDRICKLDVKEAQDGDEVRQGLVLIAPGDYQMKVYKKNSKYFVRCFKGEKVSGHCPSVDVLFDSVADEIGNQSIGVILTGMGRDGAKGLMRMKKNGSYTIGQDENTSVVYGMPMVAYNIGAVKKQLSLDKISQELVKYLNTK